MGFLKKLTKKTIGGKLTAKAIAHDPIGKKVLGKSKLMQATGLVPSRPRGGGAAVAKGYTDEVPRRAVRTGGNDPAVKMDGASRKPMRTGGPGQMNRGVSSTVPAGGGLTVGPKRNRRSAY